MSDGVEPRTLIGQEVKAIVDEAKADLRREMRYLLVIGVAAGNVVAAYVLSKVGAHDTAQSTLHAARSLLGV